MATLKDFVPDDVKPVLVMIEKTWAHAHEIQPMAFVGKGNSVGIVPMQFRGEDAKDFYAKALRDLVKELDAQWIVFVSESWVLKLEGMSAEQSRAEYSRWMKLHGTLASHPKRREVIIVNYENRHGGKMGMIEIRPDRTLAPIEWQQTDANEGRFTGFFKKS